MGTRKVTTGMAALLAGVSVASWQPPAHTQNAAPRTSQPRVLQLAGAQGSWIGVTVREPGASADAGQKPQDAAGVIVESVSKDSPAEAAGIKAGDVILEFDGERVRSLRQFSRLVQETPAGRKAATIVMRDGQKTTLAVEPRAQEGMHYFGDMEGWPDVMRRVMPVPPVPPAPPSAPSAPAPPAPPAAPLPRNFFEFDGEGLLARNSGRLGVTVSELQPQLAEYFGAKDGVLVASVSADSAASKAGVRAGDVITALDGQAVRSAADLRRQTSRLADGAAFSLEIVRDKKSTTLKGKVDAAAERRRRVVL